MAGDGDLRVGPWVPAPGDRPGELPAGELRATEPSATGPAAGEGGNWWDALPDPWDRPQPGAGDEEPTADIHLGAPGSARSGRYAGARRIAAVVVTVGAILVGTGVLATRLAADREVVLAPPPTAPSEPVVTSPPDPVTDLGRAPTVGPAPGRPATGSPPRGDPTPGDPTPTPEPATAAVTASHEAEDAELGWFTDAYSEEAASGGSAVEMGTFLGMGGYVRFEEVSASEPGQYELTVHYLSEQDSTGLVTVNGRRSTTVEFPGLDRDSQVGTVNVPVELVDGDNTIVFEPDGGSAPDLDRIDVSR